MYRYFEVKVIIYLRKQEYWIELAYNQVTKTGKINSNTIQDFIIKDNLSRYLNRFFIWERTFKKENIILKIYKEGKESKWIYNDFLSIFGIVLHDKMKFPDFNKQNRSIAPEIINSINISNNLFQNEDAIRKYVNYLSDKCMPISNRNILTKEQCNYIELKYEQFNKTIANKYFNSKDLTFSDFNELNIKKHYISDQELMIDTIRFLTNSIIVDMHTYNEKYIKQLSEHEVVIEKHSSILELREENDKLKCLLKNRNRIIKDKEREILRFKATFTYKILNRIHNLKCYMARLFKFFLGSKK